MRRILAIFICAALLCAAAFSVPASAETGESGETVSILRDLGLLVDYAADADVTREEVLRFIELMNGDGSYQKYINEYDLTGPVLYGQVLMILVDITGYVPFLEEYALDAGLPESYYTVAQRMGLKGTRAEGYDQPIKMSDYAGLIYSAMTDVSLLRARYYADGRAEYYIDRGSTLMDSVLGLTEKYGIVTGVEDTSLDSREEGQPGRIAIDYQWYDTGLEGDMLQYLGMRVRVLTDEDEESLRSLLVRENDNNVTELETEDIVEVHSLTSVSYQKAAGRKKTITIDAEADFIYNRRLLQAYTMEDLCLPDSSYKFIDNDRDSKADVIIADCYDVFMTDSVIPDTGTIIDTDGQIYDLSEYIAEGGKLYSDSGSLMELDDVDGYNIISAQVLKDGTYTNFIVSKRKESGIIISTKENWKYITISSAEYTCLERYYKHRGDFEKVEVGDEAELYFDFRGYVAEIRQITNQLKAGYILGGATTEFGGYQFRMLQEDGSIGVVAAANRVLLDGVKQSAQILRSYAPLYEDGAVKQQLVLYKQSGSGEMYWLDTAEDKSGIGSSGNEGFTLDYDWEKDGTLRALSLNSQKVIGSKYIPAEDTKVFGVNEEREMYYVQAGTSVPTQTSLNIEMYNVDENYIPEYIVINSGGNIGAWVDWSKTPYVVEGVSQVYDETDEEVKYCINYHDGTGNSYSNTVAESDLITPNGNVASNDSSLRSVKVQDIPKGSVIQVNDDSGGITSFALQLMPKEDDSEVIFERTNSSTGWDYGITTTMYNGAQIFSYGQVLRRVPGGIIINNHLPTDVEAAAGETFPIKSWDRTIPLSAGTVVWFYDKAEDTLEQGTATEIVAGDMIYIHRSSTTFKILVVYR